MISVEKFNLVRERFGLFASWAIWAEANRTPKSNMGDLSIFEETQLHRTLTHLHVNYILIGLNISTIEITTPLSNFHGTNGEVYKARFALQGTALWGGYMTDIIKDFQESDSKKLVSHLKSNPEFERENIADFRNEIAVLEASKPTLVAFGNDVFEILHRHFSKHYKIIKIPHYAWRVNKEVYRATVEKCLKES